MSIGEFELIERFFHRSLNAEGVVKGIGDDCAVLALPSGQQLALSVDTLVEGLHFPIDAPADLIAERALRVNLSDLAAMGADPLWFTLALTLPSAECSWLEAFSQGLFRVAAEYNIALVGGDTTKGPLTITLQVHGSVPNGEAITRSGAKAGDRVFVTGSLGDGAASLALIQGKISPSVDDISYLQERYYRPLPCINEGRLLRGLASAAIDISDGLAADLGHICEQSGVGAKLYIGQLPVADVLLRSFSQQQATHFALSGGDDYQLCFTVPEHKLATLQIMIESGKLRATCIGEITKELNVVCLNRDNEVVSPEGFDHFKAYE